jgi:BlaI family penicillinase repressor
MKISITDSEWKIMNLLWDHAETVASGEEQGLTIKEISDALYADTAWSRHTVISFLNRLEAKGAVSFERKNGAKVYYTKLSRQEASMADTQELLDRVYSGSFPLMVSTFAKHSDLDAEDIAELEDILSKLEEKAKGDDKS